MLVWKKLELLPAKLVMPCLRSTSGYTNSGVLCIDIRNAVEAQVLSLPSKQSQYNSPLEGKLH